jgi:hypothetical protein
MNLSPREFKRKTAVIVQFGPPTETSGFRGGEYYAVTIDPTKVCNGFIRFGENRGDEITGWQRINALTVVEILGEWDESASPEQQKFAIGADSVHVQAIEGI